LSPAKRISGALVSYGQTSMTVDRSQQVKVLVISGSMGSGKTTVIGEASDILSARGIPHAAIDLDALGVACIDYAVSAELATRNLAAVWANYLDAPSVLTMTIGLSLTLRARC
jgi:hypothetical protein